MRFYKGADPNQWTMRQYMERLDRIGDLMEREIGKVDHRARVERNMRRMKRQRQ